MHRRRQPATKMFVDIVTHWCMWEQHYTHFRGHKEASPSDTPLQVHMSHSVTHQSHFDIIRWCQASMELYWKSEEIPTAVACIESCTLYNRVLQAWPGRFVGNLNIHMSHNHWCPSLVLNHLDRVHMTQLDNHLAHTSLRNSLGHWGDIHTVVLWMSLNLLLITYWIFVNTDSRYISFWWQIKLKKYDKETCSPLIYPLHLLRHSCLEGKRFSLPWQPP